MTTKTVLKCKVPYMNPKHRLRRNILIISWNTTMNVFSTIIKAHSVCRINHMNKKQLVNLHFNICTIQEGGIISHIFHK